MHSLSFSELNENSFQGILVVSSTPKLTSSDWLKRIIENSQNKSNLEFQPVLENGTELLHFDVDQPANIEPIKCHRAMLDNKYYDTRIYLVELNKPIEFPERFYEFIHGILIYVDNDDENCLKKLNVWTQYIDLMENCAIKILSYENAAENHPVSRIDLQNHCIETGFELIELMPSDKGNHNKSRNHSSKNTCAHDAYQEFEDDFQEPDSFERLYKAIQAYVWPNLNYKEKHCTKSILSDFDEPLINRMNRLNFTTTTKTTTSIRNESEKIESEKSKPIDHNQGPTKASQSNPNEISQSEADNFENLFSKFSQIKETTSQLEDEERKRYAEQVAIAFWNSVSDDKDEVLLSSDEEDKQSGSDPNHVYI